jgi:hypothetical protein
VEKEKKEKSEGGIEKEGDQEREQKRETETQTETETETEKEKEKEKEEEKEKEKEVEKETEKERESEIGIEFEREKDEQKMIDTKKPTQIKKLFVGQIDSEKLAMNKHLEGRLSTKHEIQKQERKEKEMKLSKKNSFEESGKRIQRVPTIESEKEDVLVRDLEKKKSVLRSRVKNYEMKKVLKHYGIHAKTPTFSILEEAKRIEEKKILFKQQNSSDIDVTSDEDEEIPLPQKRKWNPRYFCSDYVFF